MNWLLFLMACSGDGNVDKETTTVVATTTSCADAPDVNWDGWAHGFFLTYCAACHTQTNTEHRVGAPEGVDFNREVDVYTWGARIRERVIDEATMPVGGGVYEDDLYLLDVYLTCRLGV